MDYAKKAFNNSTSSVTRVPSPFSNGPTLSIVLLLLLMNSKKPFSFSLTSLARYISLQLQKHGEMGLGLPCLISTYSDNFSIFFPSGWTLLPPPVYFLLTLEQRQKFLVHPWRSLALFDYLLTRMHCSWPWEKWSLNINQLSLILLTCRAHSHEIQGDPWGGLLRCPEVHGCSLTCCSAFSSSDTELHNFIVTTAKAALILCISNKTFPVCYNEVKQHTIPCGTVHRLCQELVLNTFQEHPGLCGLLCHFSSRCQGSSSPA